MQSTLVSLLYNNTFNINPAVEFCAQYDPKGLVNNYGKGGGYKMGGGGGAREVLPLRKGGAEKVLAMLKGGHKKFLG